MYSYAYEKELDYESQFDIDDNDVEFVVEAEILTMELDINF